MTLRKKEGRGGREEKKKEHERRKKKHIERHIDMRGIHVYLSLYMFFSFVSSCYALPFQSQKTL
jgi:hypothetical protein